MRLLLNDYGGHAFPVQLSRELARRGWEVLHVYAGYNQTPHGALERTPADPPGFQSKPLYISHPLQKYSFVKRWFQEREFGQLLAAEIRTWHPDVVLSANTPLDAQALALSSSHKIGARFIFWLQDVIGIATHRLLSKKNALLGAVVGRYYIALEKILLRRSDRVVLITQDFEPLMREWGVRPEACEVTPNWAPLAELPVRDHRNSWAAAHGLQDKFCFLYTGTLGMKHNPDLLLQIALKFRSDSRVAVVVASEGPGADWLKDKVQEHHLQNLKLVGYQPMQDYPDVLASGDVLVAVLEPEAGVFSVPSKVLSYFCAQRALLLALPTENLATRMVQQQQAGRVVAPTDTEAFVKAAQEMYQSPQALKLYGENARRYAEQQFDIEKIGNRFERILGA